MLTELVLLQSVAAHGSLPEAASALGLDAEEADVALTELAATLGLALVTNDGTPTPSLLALVGPSNSVLASAATFFEAAEHLAAITPARVTAPSLCDPRLMWRPDARLATAVAVTDKRGRYQQANEQFQRMVDRTSAELVGLGFERITFEDDLASDRAVDELLFSGARSASTKRKSYVRPDGQLVSADVTFTRVVDQGDVHLLVVARPPSAARTPATIPGQ